MEKRGREKVSDFLFLSLSLVPLKKTTHLPVARRAPARDVALSQQLHNDLAHRPVVLLAVWEEKGGKRKREKERERERH